jgi:DNA-binding IclR family transcriptional regulator
MSLFTVDEPELTLAEMTKRLGFSKPTVHRYATALRQAGLLRASGGGYTLGPRVVEMASAALAGLGVIKIVGPYLERLVTDTSQTGVLSVWDGEAPVVVRVQDNAHRMVRIIVTTGSRLPLESAQGQIFRAFMDGWGDDAALRRVRRNRVAWSAEVIDGIAALASPIFQGEEIVATVALVGTTAVIERSPNSAMASTLKATAEAVTAELGFVGEEAMA